MKCPLLAIANPAETERESPSLIDCMREDCAWWNERFGICCMAVEAFLLPSFLKGQEDYRLEVKQAMKDRW